MTWVIVNFRVAQSCIFSVAKVMHRYPRSSRGVLRHVLFV